MGEYRDVRRKIVKWTEVVREPQYTAVLDCGHPYPGEYDEPLSADTKDHTPSFVVCVPCTREENELRAAEATVRELKERRARRT
jgi:hypothetical protein